jgi:hypothetical protein
LIPPTDKRWTPVGSTEAKSVTFQLRSAEPASELARLAELRAVAKTSGDVQSI